MKSEPCSFSFLCVFSLVLAGFIQKRTDLLKRLADILEKWIAYSMHDLLQSAEMKSF